MMRTLLSIFLDRPFLFSYIRLILNSVSLVLSNHPLRLKNKTEGRDEMKKRYFYGLHMSVFIFLFIFSQVRASDLFVSSGGTDTPCAQSHPCSLQAALTQANDYDVIFIAQGTYTGTGDAVMTITKTIDLLGGWDGSTQKPVKRDPEAYPTLIHGEDQRQGISISGDIAPTIDGFTITGGKAPDGGGISIHNASPLIRNNIITSNRTITSGSYKDGRGGGIFADGKSSAAVTQNQISNNNSGYGGGIYSASSQGIRVTSNIIIQNTASHRAGGFLAENSPDRIQGNVISSNTAAEDGGGILVWSAAPIIDANHLVGNSASSGAGISLGNNARPILSNNLMVNNSRDGIIASSSSPSVVNNTIVGDGLNTSRYGIYLYASTDCEPPYCTGGAIKNNIIVTYGTGVYGNGPVTTSVDYNNLWGNVTGNNSLPGSAAVGTHNISADPVFQDESIGNYHLKGGSPCVNAGDPVGTPAAFPTDLDGNLRDALPDMGAYEFTPVRPNVGTLGTEITITGSEFGTKKNKVLLGQTSLKVLEWTNGTIRCTVPKALQPGPYDVIVQPWKAGQIVLDNAFTVAAPEIETINPVRGSTNDQITINGFFFGTKKGKVTIGGKNSRVILWTMDPVTGESEIKAVAPRGLNLGPQELKVTNGVGSDSVNFTID
jgi:parallel beta-helix repeat protein